MIITNIIVIINTSLLLEEILDTKLIKLQLITKYARDNRRNRDLFEVHARPLNRNRSSVCIFILIKVSNVWKQKED